MFLSEMALIHSKLHRCSSTSCGRKLVPFVDIFRTTHMFSRTHLHAHATYVHLLNTRSHFLSTSSIRAHMFFSPPLNAHTSSVRLLCTCTHLSSSYTRTHVLSTSIGEYICPPPPYAHTSVHLLRTRTRLSTSSVRAHVFLPLPYPHTSVYLLRTRTRL